MKVGVLSMIYDRDTSSWRMSRGYLQQIKAKQSTEFSKILPRAGYIDLSGRLFQLDPLVVHTYASDSLELGRWETPNTMDHLPARTGDAYVKALHRGDLTKNTRRTSTGNLRENPKVTGNWPTPTTKGYRASEGEVMIMRAEVEKGNLTEEEAETMLGSTLRPPRMKAWPTPSTQDNEHEDLKLNEKGRRKAKNGGESRSLNLADKVQVQSWSTPRASQASKPINQKAPSVKNKKHGSTLEMDVGERNKKLIGRRLNYGWVARLMGYPDGWLDLD